MKLGKLTTDELNNCVLRHLKKTREEVLLSASVGEDCAALSLPGTVLVSSDPITAVMENAKIGALCVSVCCNDVSANGGIPVAMTLTVIMPPTCDACDVDEIMQGASRRASELGVDIVGGHTEFSDCVTRPIVSGTAIGLTDKLIKKDDLAVGDKLFVTKKLALEGTCILADIVRPTLNSDEQKKIERFNSMLDVSTESKLLRALDCVSTMHDVTEGGILGAVAEICYARGFGATLYEDKMPVDELTERLCKDAKVNPLRLISSGSMLVACTDEEPVRKALEGTDIEVTFIGEVTNESEVTLIKRDGKKERIEVLPDELYKF